MGDPAALEAFEAGRARQQRARDLSQFWTSEEDAALVVAAAVERLPACGSDGARVGMDSLTDGDFAWIEPSAGAGAIFSKLPRRRAGAVGVDIDGDLAERHGWVSADFLGLDRDQLCRAAFQTQGSRWCAPNTSYCYSRRHTVVVGNPPFTSVRSGGDTGLAAKFIQHAVSMADTVVMLLPGRFAKPEVQQEVLASAARSQRHPARELAASRFASQKEREDWMGPPAELGPQNRPRRTMKQAAAEEAEASSYLSSRRLVRCEVVRELEVTRFSLRGEKQVAQPSVILAFLTDDSGGGPRARRRHQPVEHEERGEGVDHSGQDNKQSMGAWAAPGLPHGWRRVASRSRPGEFSFENIYTLKRQVLPPTEAAQHGPGGGAHSGAWEPLAPAALRVASATAASATAAAAAAAPVATAPAATAPAATAPAATAPAAAPAAAASAAAPSPAMGPPPAAATSTERKPAEATGAGSKEGQNEGEGEEGGAEGTVRATATATTCGAGEGILAKAMGFIHGLDDDEPQAVEVDALVERIEVFRKSATCVSARSGPLYSAEGFVVAFTTLSVSWTDIGLEFKACRDKRRDARTMAMRRALEFARSHDELRHKPKHELIKLLGAQIHAQIFPREEPRYSLFIPRVPHELRHADAEGVFDNIHVAAVNGIGVTCLPLKELDRIRKMHLSTAPCRITLGCCSIMAYEAMCWCSRIIAQGPQDKIMSAKGDDEEGGGKGSGSKKRSREEGR